MNPGGVLKVDRRESQAVQFRHYQDIALPHQVEAGTECWRTTVSYLPTDCLLDTRESSHTVMTTRQRDVALVKALYG